MKKLELFTILGLVFGSSFNISAEDYIVKKDDTLSSIAHKFDLKPIYGKKGSINKLKKLNKIKNKNRIYPGQVIKIPDSKNLPIPHITHSEEQSHSNNSKCENVSLEKVIVKENPIIGKERSISLEISGFNYNSSNLSTLGASSIPTGFNIFKYTENEWSEFFNSNIQKSVSYNYIRTSSSDIKSTNKVLGLLNFELGLLNKMNNGFLISPSIVLGDDLYANNETSKVYLESFKSISLKTKFEKPINTKTTLNSSIQVGTSIDLKESRITYKLSIGADYKIKEKSPFSLTIRNEMTGNQSTSTSDKNNSILIGIKYDF